MEAALKSTGTVLSALRSGHFQEKLADVLDTARESGIYPVFAGSADVPIPMVATADLGAVAARVSCNHLPVGVKQSMSSALRIRNEPLQRCWVAHWVGN